MKKSNGYTEASGAEETLLQSKRTITLLRYMLKSARTKLKNDEMLKHILNRKLHGIPMEIEDVNIIDTILPRNIRDRLSWNGIETVRELKKKTDDDLLIILKPVNAEKSLNMIREFMTEAGLSLKKKTSKEG